MPNRILRDWTDSYTIEPLSAEAERLFTRLIMKADDFGRYHADPRLVRAGCFPLLSNLRDTDISRWLAECEKAGLIAVYQAGGRSYLTIKNFNQRLRTKNAKYPADDGQTTVNCQSNDGQLSSEEKRREVEEREKGTRADEPLIPVLEDVLAFTRGAPGIPDDYAKHYVDTCCVKRRWLVSTPIGPQVIDWRREIVSWWVKDRAKWRIHGTQNHNNGAGNRNAGTANAGKTSGYSAAASAKLSRGVSNQG